MKSKRKKDNILLKLLKIVLKYCMLNIHKFRGKIAKKKKKRMMIKSKNKKLLIKIRRGSVINVFVNKKVTKMSSKNKRNQGLFPFNQGNRSSAYFMDYQTPQISQLWL